MTRIRLFTHPICSGCAEALALVQRLATDEPEIQVEVISLASAAGRAAAQEAGIVVVPTFLIDGERLTGVPTFEELRARVQHAARTGG